MKFSFAKAGAACVKTAAMILFAAALSACASGAKLGELSPDQTGVQSGKGQIIVYRPEIFGAAWQPTVHVDGRETGKCTAKGVFAVDVEPGTYDVSAATETESKVRVDVQNGERVYVNCTIGIGVFAGRPKLKQVDETVGENESRKLAFTGRF